MAIVITYILVPLISFFLVFSVKAEEILSWDDCVKAAKANNPDLISAKASFKQAQADKQIAQSDVLPQISTTLTAKKNKAYTSSKQAESYTYAVTGKQLLFDGFKTFNQITSTNESLKAAWYNYEVVSSNVRLNLNMSFAQLLRAQELISLTEEIAQRRKQNLDLVKLRYDAGREHKGALLTAQADLAQADFEVKQAKRNFLFYQIKLIKTIGFKNRFEIRAKGEFVISRLDVARPNFENVAETIPFLKELAAKKEAVRFDLKAAEKDFFPEIYLNSSLGKTDTSWPPERKQWSASLDLSFPLFEGGSRLAQVSKQKSKLNQFIADERSGRDGVIITLEKTWNGLQDAVDTLDVNKKFVEAAQERAKIANSQYSTGLINFDDWIIIENNLVSAKKDYLDAQADMLISHAEWIQAKGGVLEDVEK